MFGVNEPYIIGNELKYLRKSINQNELSVGEFQKKFQKKLEKYCKSKYVTLCSSGTSALQVALHSLGIKENDEVIVPTFTFIATVNAVIYNKAIPLKKSQLLKIKEITRDYKNLSNDIDLRNW